MGFQVKSVNKEMRDISSTTTQHHHSLLLPSPPTVFTQGQNICLLYSPTRFSICFAYAEYFQLINMSNLGLFPGLGPTRAEFDNTTVLNATNPDTLLGYAHGMFPRGICC